MVLFGSFDGVFRGDFFSRVLKLYVENKKRYREKLKRGLRVASLKRTRTDGNSLDRLNLAKDQPNKRRKKRCLLGINSRDEVYLELVCLYQQKILQAQVVNTYQGTRHLWWGCHLLRSVLARVGGGMWILSPNLIVTRVERGGV